MEHLSASTLRLVIEFLHLCRNGHDHRTFALSVLNGLRPLIPFDVAADNRVDLKHGRATNIAEPADVYSPDQFAIFEQYVSEHPIAEYHFRTGDGQALRISDFLSRRAFRDLGLYQEFYHPIGVEYLMAITMIPAPTGVHGIALARQLHDFTDRERRIFDLLRPHLAGAYRDLELVRLFRESASTGGRDYMLLNDAGKVTEASDHAWDQLQRYFGTARHDAARLPDEVERWLRLHNDDLSVETMLTTSTPLVVDRGDSRLLLRFVRGGFAGTTNLLLLEEQPRSPRVSALRALGLGRREAEILRLVADGQANEEIARSLSISERTVEKHLQRAYEKLGVTSRTAAVAAAFRAFDF